MDTHTSNGSHSPHGTHPSDGLSTEAEDLLRRLQAGELVPPPTPPPDAAGQAPEQRPSLRDALAARLPPGVRGAHLDPAMRGALGLGLVALVAALAALGLAWRSAPRPVAAERPPAVSGSPATGAQVAALPAALPSVGPSALPTPTSGAALVVDVAGKVRRPGVVSLPPGARVADALAQAGGALPGTDTSALSLARKVVDGEQVLVTGQPGTAPAPATSVAPATGGTAPPSSDTAGAPSEPLDLNSATVEQFDGLPGVGPVLAGRIVEYRTAHNGFRSVDELREVKGLGGKTGSELLPLVRVG